MRTLLRSLPLLTLALLPARLPADTNRVAVAVVVHPGNPLDGLTQAELGRVLRQEKQFWDDASAIELHLPGPGLPGRALLLAECGAETEAALKKQWLSRLFRGQSRREPAQHDSPAAVAAKVAAQPRALGLLPASGLPAGVKVLAIEGRKPGDAGYALTEAPLQP